VRWLGRALAGSVAVHAVAVAVMYEWKRHHKDDVIVEAPAEDSVEITSAPPLTTMPIELVAISTPPPMVDLQPLPQAAPTPADHAPGAAPRPGSRAAISTATSRPTGPETAPGTTDSTGNRALSMRDPYRRVDGAAAGDTIARIADNGKPAPPPVPESGQLAHHGPNTTIDDRTFTAHVNDDGTVANIDDKPNFNVHIAVPHPGAMGKAIADWANDPYAYTQRLPQPGDGIETAPRGDHARIAGVTGDDQKPDQGQTPIPVIAGGFDVTDWIARKALGKAKGDPYAARKRAALEATFDERLEMGRMHRKQALDHAEQSAQASLESLWSSNASLRDKKEGIFEMWDDCAESGEPVVVAAGARARLQIVRFIRVRLPRGSDAAFTSAELDSFNAHKTSHARFAPYDLGSDPDDVTTTKAPAAPSR
jgi:hypothetical protein